MHTMTNPCILFLLVGACSALPQYTRQEVCPSPYVCVPEGQCNGTIMDTTGTKDWWLLVNIRTSASMATCGDSNIYGICCDNSPDEYPVASQCGVKNGEPIFDVDIRIQNTLSYNDEAQFGEFPWQARILLSNNSFKCGASLVGDRWLITAAHKVNGLTPSDLKVRLGEWHINNLDEPKPHLDVDVAAITIHPLFNPRNIHNDIAVLQLAEPVTFQYHINSICLPSSGQTFWGKRCIATGWGNDSFDGNYQHTMKKVELPTVEHQQCQSLLRKTSLGRYFRLDDSFMCAGGEENKDAYEGDGGGPLACQDPVTGRYVLTGITAWGIGCGNKGVPGVYADVQALLPFIQTVITDNFEKEPIFDVDERIQSNNLYN